jgi:PleD family two-component response regulator
VELRVCKEIKKIAALRGVPVCMLSTSADPLIEKQAKSLGAFDFIKKQANITELSRQLERFFNLNFIDKDE